MSITSRITGEQKISGFVSIYNQNNENIEKELEKYKKDYENISNSLQGQFDTIYKKLKTDLSYNLTNFSSKISDLESSLSDIQDELKLYDDVNINGVQGQIENLNEIFKSNIVGVQGQIGAISKKITDLQSTHNSGIQGVQSQIGSISTELSDFKTSITETHNSGIQGIQGQINTLNSGIQGVQSQINDLSKDLTDFDAHVKIHVQDYISSTKGIQNMTEIIEPKVDEKLNEIIGDSDYTNQIDEINGRIETLENKIGNYYHSQTLENLCKVVDEIRTQLNKNGYNIPSYPLLDSFGIETKD